MSSYQFNSILIISVYILVLYFWIWWERPRTWASSFQLDYLFRTGMCRFLDRNNNQ